jgi:GTP pyrophosphokinase
MKPEFIEAACKKYTCKDLDDLYAMIGHGGLKESQLLSKLLEEQEKKRESEKTDADILNEIENQKQKHTSASNTSGVLIKGFEDLAVKFAKCCSPVPGDEIVGFVTRGSGITIHKTDCKNIMSLPDIERERLLKIEWADSVGKSTDSYFARVAVYTQNKMGQVMNISRVMTESNINILDLSSKVGKNDTGTIILGFNVPDKNTLSTIMSKLNAIDGVIEVQRI